MHYGLVRLELIPAADATTEPALRSLLAGGDVFRWSDGPGAAYSPHSHDHDETICLLEGAITFTAGGKTIHLARAGDRLNLPAGTVHAAEAGPAGATYLIAEHR